MGIEGTSDYVIFYLVHKNMSAWGRHFARKCPQKVDIILCYFIVHISKFGKRQADEAGVADQWWNRTFSIEVGQQQTQKSQDRVDDFPIFRLGEHLQQNLKKLNLNSQSD